MASQCLTFRDAVEMALALERDFIKSKNDREASEKKKRKNESKGQPSGQSKKKANTVSQGQPSNFSRRCNKCGGNHNRDYCNY